MAASEALQRAAAVTLPLARGRANGLRASSSQPTLAVHPALSLALRGLAPLSAAPAAADSADEDDLAQCCICLDGLRPGQRSAVFPCGHRLHAACAGRWLRAATRPACPTCRRPVELRPRNEDAGSPAAVAAHVPAASSTSRPAPSTPVAAARPAPAGIAPSLLLPLERLLAPASDDVAALMETCCCPREAAEAALNEGAARTAQPAADAAAAASVAAQLELRGQELLAALQAGDVSGASQLLAPGAGGVDLGLRSGGRTALQLAVEGRHYYVVRLICEALASRSAGLRASAACDIDAALALASARGYAEIAALLQSFGAQPPRASGSLQQRRSGGLWRQPWHGVRVKALQR
eukprot:TRINITY_DN30068_c0_g1_i1.p1 TRINITY_DN30068_c0_g1~~TRINITY_DN30068_c0_g1_i1.p1  ORF type:complete len:376 (-),score=78.59 TRINITY_DN30068_c0_g1_i1:43-1098(-)